MVLHHNLSIGRDAALLSQETCRSFGASADLIQVNDDVGSASPHTKVFVWSNENHKLEEK
jgi:hypothetical protein